MRKSKVTWLPPRPWGPGGLSGLAVSWLVVVGLALALPGGAMAQGQIGPGGGTAGAERPKARRLSARELNYLLLLAKEPLNAMKEGREARPLPAITAPALTQAVPLAVTLWLDGQILARAWEIRQPQPVGAGIFALSSKVLSEPDQGRAPTLEEWPRVKIGVAVLHQLDEAADDKAVGKGQAVVVLEGFTIGLGLPKDMPGKYENSELLSKACQMAGLRPNSWLLPEKLTIFAADVDELVEG